jgi:hypothetical protein
MSGDFAPSGAGDKARAIYLRDNSKSASAGGGGGGGGGGGPGGGGGGGIPEADERGNYQQTVFGFVEEVDERGLITRETQVVLQPRNWHLLRGDVVRPELPEVKDLRADIALIADHQHGFGGWDLDKDEKSPFLDDWFLDDGEIQKSTRIVDYGDPKGRTALLAQLVKVTDDHLQQYTTALVLGREIGEHKIAAAGYVHDNDNEFNGLLDTFWTTNHADKDGAGREGTPWGCVGLWHDAHVEFPFVAHGRFHISREFCDDYEEMPPRSAGGGGSAPSDGEEIELGPQVHYYKSRHMFDHTVKGRDTRNKHEDAQLRPVYHCIDGPAKKKIYQNITINNFEYIQNVFIDNSVHNGGVTIIIVIVNGGPGGGTNTWTFKPGSGEPPTVTETPPPAGGTTEKPPEPPPGGGTGRVICLPLTSNPPYLDGVEHPDHGYLCFGKDDKGRTRAWVGGWNPLGGDFGSVSELGFGGTSDASGLPFVDDVAAGTIGGAVAGDASTPGGSSILSAGWDPLVSVPADAAAGSVPIADGEGGFAWGLFEEPSTPATPPTATDLINDILGISDRNPASLLNDGYKWAPDADDPRKLRLQRYDSGSFVETALLVDGKSPKAIYGFGGARLLTVDDLASFRGETPQGYISGFTLAYNAASASLVDVSGSICRDTTDSYDIEVAGPSPVDYLSTGGLLANDGLTTADTGATGDLVNAAGTNTTVTTKVGGVNTAVTAILPAGIALTGLCDVNIPDASLTSTLSTHAGSATKFLSELAVGDLVGFNGWFWCVLAVDSDSSAQVRRGTPAAGDTGIALSGYAATKYENLMIQVGGTSTAAQHVVFFTGATILAFGHLNGNVNGTGLNVVFGQPAPGGTTFTDSTPRTYKIPTWMFLWARRKADETSTLSWSSQRTTPYSPSALTNYSIWRRVGVLPIGADNFVVPFTQTNLGPNRIYMFEDDPAAANFDLRFLNAAGAAVAWTRLALQHAVPPVSVLALVYAEVQGHNAGAGVVSLYLRAASAGSAAVTRPKLLKTTATTVNCSEYWVATDKAQCLDYIFNQVGGFGNCSLYGIGYVDVP